MFPKFQGMAWKKSLFYFYWQVLKYASNVRQLRENLGGVNRWKSSFQPGRNSVADELPWLNFPAVAFLQTGLQPGSKVFEFGGGGSTLFFCKNGAEVATVEDHAEWFKILTDTVAAKGYAAWRGFFVSPTPYTGTLQQRDPANPDHFLSAAKGLEKMSFEAYARAINTFPTEHFDVILVDGRARPSCIKQAIPHLKMNGLLVIDNTEREYYLTHFQAIISSQFKVELHEFAPVAYTPDFTRTTILRKTR